MFMTSVDGGRYKLWGDFFFTFHMDSHVSVPKEE